MGRLIILKFQLLSSPTMAHKGNGQIVRYQKGKLKFEVLTKKGSVAKYRAQRLGLQHVLLIDTIYSKCSQGKVAKSTDLKRVFGTADFMQCACQILENGDLSLSSSERKAKNDAKKHEIVYYINKNYINPLSKCPHPSARILSCMDECNIKINATKSTKTQSLNAINKMSGKLFFAKAAALNISLSIKYKYDINKIGQLINRISGGSSYQQKWNEKGCVFVMELSKADLEDLGNKLNKLTNGGDYDLKFEDFGGVKEAGCTKKSSRKYNEYMMEQKDLKKLNRKRKKNKT